MANRSLKKEKTEGEKKKDPEELELGLRRKGSGKTRKEIEGRKGTGGKE